MNEGVVDLGKKLVTGPLFTISGTPIDGPTLLIAVLVLVLTNLLAKFLGNAVLKSELLKKLQAPSARLMTERLVKGLVWFLGFSIAVGTLGIDLGALFAAGAVFAVGAGLAFQNVAQNIVAGLLLIFEQTIKPGDILLVEGTLVRVDELRLRATVGRTLDDESIIIPNATLAKDVVRNFTLTDSLYRLRAQVGVSYTSDLELVDEVLYQTARQFPARTKERDPRVLCTGFGDSNVNFDVSIWTNDPWSSPMTLSSLRREIFKALREHGITIAFPQVDLHVDQVLLETLARPEPREQPPSIPS